MVVIRWKPIKNTEREAQRKHGEKWLHQNVNWHGPQGQQSLITSPDKLDLRWIFDHQIMGAENV